MTSDRDVRPELGDHPHVLDLGIPTAADSGVGDPPPIVAVMIVGQNPRDASQSRAVTHARKRALARLAVFSSRGADWLS